MRKKHGQKSYRSKTHRHTQDVILKAISDLPKSQLNAMMTQSLDEALAFVANVLKKTLENEGTPATALVQLSKTYLDVIEEIDKRAREKTTENRMDAASLDMPVDMSQI